MQLPTRLYTAEQSRSLDAAVIADGIDSFKLMQRAAQACFDQLQRIIDAGANICVVCGLGNNAGDGYLVAALAHAAGYAVKVLHVADPDKLQGDARRAFDHCAGRGVSILRYSDKQVEKADFIVDAIFGTGLSRPVEGDFADAVAGINSCEVPVVSVDIPSGLCADTGAVLGVAVCADVTATFIGLKVGQFTGQGPERVGTLVFDDLGAPEAVLQNAQYVAERLDACWLQSQLEPLSKVAHKGSRGKVLVVGGDLGMAGAPVLAALGAMRAGAGMVKIATRPTHAGSCASHLPEIMCQGVAQEDGLGELIDWADAIVIGPGLGRSEWSEALFGAALQSGLPMVLDADALYWLGQSDQELPKHCVLTPHPGEAARLLDTTIDNIESDRPRAVAKIHQQFGAVALLKGAGTLVQGDALVVCSAGNPGMGTAGSGDVLSGVVGAQLAAGHNEEVATQIAVVMHAVAGDLASRDGERGMMATDIAQALRGAANP